MKKIISIAVILCFAITTMFQGRVFGLALSSGLIRGETLLTPLEISEITKRLDAIEKKYFDGKKKYEEVLLVEGKINNLEKEITNEKSDMDNVIETIKDTENIIKRLKSQHVNDSEEIKGVLEKLEKQINAVSEIKKQYKTDKAKTNKSIRSEELQKKLNLIQDELKFNKHIIESMKSIIKQGEEITSEKISKLKVEVEKLKENIQVVEFVKESYDNSCNSIDKIIEKIRKLTTLKKNDNVDIFLHSNLDDFIKKYWKDDQEENKFKKDIFNHIQYFKGIINRYLEKIKVKQKDIKVQEYSEIQKVDFLRNISFQGIKQADNSQIFNELDINKKDIEKLEFFDKYCFSFKTYAQEELNNNAENNLFAPYAFKVFDDLKLWIKGDGFINEHFIENVKKFCSEKGSGFGDLLENAYKNLSKVIKKSGAITQDEINEIKNKWKTYNVENFINKNQLSKYKNNISAIENLIWQSFSKEKEFITGDVVKTSFSYTLFSEFKEICLGKDKDKNNKLSAQEITKKIKDNEALDQTKKELFLQVNEITNIILKLKDMRDKTDVGKKSLIIGDEKIYIGNYKTARNILKGNQEKEWHVISFYDDKRAKNIAKLHRIECYVEDYGHLSDVQKYNMYMPILLKEVNDVLNSKGKEKLLSNCKQGVSRSSTLIIAYLMFSNSMSFADAKAFVKARRVSINPQLEWMEYLARGINIHGITFDIPEMLKKVDEMYQPENYIKSLNIDKIKEIIKENKQFEFLQDIFFIKTDITEKEGGIKVNLVDTSKDILLKLVREYNYKKHLNNYLSREELGIIVNGKINGEEDENEKELGDEVWDILVQNGYIDETGVICTEKFNEGFNINLKTSTKISEKISEKIKEKINAKVFTLKINIENIEKEIITSIDVMDEFIGELKAAA